MESWRNAICSDTVRQIRSRILHINAVLAAVGYNFRLLLKWLALLCAVIRGLLIAGTPRQSLSSPIGFTDDDVVEFRRRDQAMTATARFDPREESKQHSPKRAEADIAGALRDLSSEYLAKCGASTGCSRSDRVG
jgi:hypothetical protein